MHERVADRRGGIKLARRECLDREREALLPWPSHSRTFLEGTMHQKLLIDR